MDYRSSLQFLNRLLDETITDRGCLALIEGRLGMGKTHLLNEFTRNVVESGALLLSAAGSRGEQVLQFGLADQLFRSPGMADLLPDWVSQLATDAAGPSVDEAPDRRRHHVGRIQDLCRLLIELSAARPLVICIDDVQFADAVSLEFLLAMQKRLRGARVLIVLSEWSRTQPTLPLFRAELTRNVHHHIRLSALSRQDICDILTDDLGAAVTEEMVDSYLRVTGGNPMFVHALVDDHHCGDIAVAGDDNGIPTVGASYSQTVIASLHRWERQLLETARAVAVLGPRADLALVAQVLNVHHREAEENIRTLSDAGLLDGVRFRHPLAVSAVLNSMSSNECGEMSLAVAELLYQVGATSAEISPHLLNARRAEASWAIVALRDAAEQAVAVGETTLAVQYLELALSSCTRPRDQLAVTQMLTRILWWTNPSAAVPYLAQLHKAVSEGELTGADLTAIVRYSLWYGHEEAAANALAELSDSADKIDAYALVELSLVYRRYFGSTRGRFEEFGLVEDPKDPWSDAVGRLATWVHDRGEDILISAEEILQSTRLEDTAIEVVTAAVLALMGSSKYDQARFWCERLSEQAARQGAVTWQAVLGALCAQISLRCGDLAGAVKQAEAALELLPVRAWGVLIGVPRATLVLARTARGEFDDAAGVLSQWVPEAMFTTVIGLEYLHARGHYLLATERPLAASRDFQTCGRLMREWEVDLPSLILWRIDLAEANLRLGRVAEALQLVRQQLERQKHLDARSKGISLRVLAAASDLGLRSTLLRQAVEHLQSADDPLELSKALADISELHRQTSEFESARVLARHAGQVPHDGGRTTAASRASGDGTMHNNGHGNAAQPHPRYGDEIGRSMLSEAEYRVASLAAMGHTNREIGRTLFITVSTVEQHLTRIYRKLGVTRRADLPTDEALQLQLRESKAENLAPAQVV